MVSRATKAIGAFAGHLSVTACSIFGSAVAPEPDYGVTHAEPPFELRDYGELVVVKTAMTNGSRAAFGRLFEFISDANSGAREIAMTAPVLQSRDGARKIIFLLPETMTLETAPVPTDPRVSLATIPPRRVAVVRYFGSMSSRAAAEEARLRDWIAGRDLQPTGRPKLQGTTHLGACHPIAATRF